ncbi:MAG: alkaline phosphatase family protein [Vulcanimicrobiota bacterium]
MNARRWLAVGLMILAQLAPALAKEPRLVVVLVIDQFRQDYLDRFHAQFQPDAPGRPGGFSYLLEHGAVHTRCFYDHVPNHTAVGHAALATGALPAVHGIVGNRWYDRDEGEKNDVAFDPDFPLVGTAAQGGVSPRALLSTTVGDELKLASMGHSRIFGVAIKDRAAMLTTGRAADLCVFYDHHTGRWISSTYYLPDGKLPAWLEAYNATGWADRLFGWEWKPYHPASAYATCRPAVFVGANGAYLDIGESYPHKFTGGLDKPGPKYYEAISFTPHGVTSTFEVARRLCQAEKLGQGDYPDLLVISLSSNDKAGHAWGPFSPEMLDITLETDRELANFLQFVDSQVGLDHTLIAFSSDHGVAPLPELAEKFRFPGGRLAPDQFRKSLNDVLVARFGPGNHLVAYNEPNLYLNRATIPAEHFAEACQLVAEKARTLPGLQAAFTRQQLEQGDLPPTELAQLAANSFHPHRSGDVMVFTQPYTIFSFNKPAGTTHGAPWNYDSHVPMIVVGPGVPAGIYHRKCTPRDLAPTLSELLHISPPAGANREVLEWLTR